jgi:hypothetical protein
MTFLAEAGYIPFRAVGAHRPLSAADQRQAGSIAPGTTAVTIFSPCKGV